MALALVLVTILPLHASTPPAGHFAGIVLPGDSTAQGAIALFEPYETPGSGNATPSTELSTTPNVQLVFSSVFPQATSTISRLFYQEGDRDQAFTGGNFTAAQPLSWYVANHPDWIEITASQSGFTCATIGDNVTFATATSGLFAPSGGANLPGQDVAWEFSNDPKMPLDGANPAVQNYIEQTWLKPALTGTLVGNVDGKSMVGFKFDGISFDNYQVANDGAYTGQRCGYYATGPNAVAAQQRCQNNASWTWHPIEGFCDQYLAVNNDPNYRATEIAMATAYTAWLHTNFPAALVSYNFTYNPSYVTDSQTLLNQIPIDFMENGFTACGANCLPQIVDSNLTTMWTFLDGWLHSSTWHALLSSNEEPGAFSGCTLPTITHAETQWALANTLLIENSSTYFWEGGIQQYSCIWGSSNFTEYSANLGTPIGRYVPYTNVSPAGTIYERVFTNGIVFANPSSTVSYTVTLPAGSYNDLYGSAQGATIALGTTAGAVLVLQTPPTPTPIPTPVPTVLPGPNRPYPVH